MNISSLGNNLKNVAKPSNVQWEEFADINVFKPIKLKAPFKEDVFMKIEEGNPYTSTYVLGIALKNKNADNVGEELFSIYPNNSIYGNVIAVNDEHKKKGFGEALRLGSVMEMIKNNCDKISISSLSKALLFHSKYKFQPNLCYQDEMKQTLHFIEDNEKFSDLKGFALRAKEIYDPNENLFDIKWQDKLIDVNKLTSDFLQKTVENKIPVDMTNAVGMKMNLTQKDVTKNKQFYDELFKKHGIDFEV